MSTLQQIDLVYLWVDGNDPHWLEKRNAYLDNKVDITGRYEDNHELKYSLRSVEKNIPWIRKIFIITDNQIPHFLDLNHPKIHIVDHTQIMPANILPVFNSMIIEHFLYKIEGLSEQFLLANDDFFVNKAVTENFFFRDGLPIMRATKQNLTLENFLKRIIGKNINTYRSAIENAHKLVNKQYGNNTMFASHHNIDAYLKSDYEFVENLFKDQIDTTTLHNRFRQPNDIQRIIVYYDSLQRGRGHLHYVQRCESIRIKAEKSDYQHYIDRYNPTLFCINDSERVTPSDRKRIKPFLDHLYPNKSSFEK